MVITCDEKIMLEKMLVSEKKLSDINFERLINALAYIKIINSEDIYYKRWW